MTQSSNSTVDVHVGSIQESCTQSLVCAIQALILGFSGWVLGLYCNLRVGTRVCFICYTASLTEPFGIMYLGFSGASFGVPFP